MIFGINSTIVLKQNLTNSSTIKNSDAVPKKDENYYTQVFLKECKDTEKEKWLIRYVNGDLETTSDNSD